MTVEKVAEYRKAVGAVVVSALGLTALFVTVDPTLEEAILGVVADVAVVATVVFARNEPSVE